MNGCVIANDRLKNHSDYGVSGHHCGTPAIARIEVVLVGGLAVEIYTENLYLTKDIDMVNTNYQSPKHLHAAMAELGFHKQGRVYVNDTTDITVEFPSAPLSVGDELIKSTTHAKVANKNIPILKVEDVVKDRLAAFIHWQDRQSLIQATAIYKTSVEACHL